MWIVHEQHNRYLFRGDFDERLGQDTVRRNLDDCFAEAELRIAAIGVVQVRLLHEMFGNHFTPIAFSLDWRTADVMLLAKGAYNDRNFGALPILADALQDAGCDAEDLLNHLRDTSATHVRGCWALDLVLGKE